MTLFEHLEELRGRLIRCVLAVAVGFILTFIWIDEVIAFFSLPLADVEEKYGDRLRLVQTQPAGVFIAAMKVAFFTGLFLVSPYILHHIWGFVGAGLYPRERKSVKFYAIPGFLLFFAGATLAFGFVLPWALDWLVSFAADAGIDSLLELDGLISFVAWSMVVFGIVFQLPLVMVFLMRIGVVEPDTFRRYRRHSIVANFALAMMLTPPDVVTQIALASCMTILYESAIFVGTRVAQPRRTGDGA